MRLKFSHLTSHLQQKLAPIYLLSGEEILQRTEALEAIIAQAKHQGFMEHHVFYSDIDFHWQDLLTEAQSQSLFASRKILDVRVQTSMDQTAINSLKTYIKTNFEHLLILSIDKLEKKISNILENKAVTISVYNLHGQMLQGWLQQRATERGLKFQPDALAFFADCVEGHLFVAKQELDKLNVLYPNATITLSDVKRLLADYSRFNLFELMDSCLQGRVKQSLHILQRLQREGVEPVLVLWGLNREIRLCYQLNFAQSQGISLTKAMFEQKVWEHHKALVKQGLERHTLLSLKQLLQHCAKIDQMIKGMVVGEVWQELTQLTLAFAGKKLIEKN